MSAELTGGGTIKHSGRDGSRMGPLHALSVDHVLPDGCGSARLPRCIAWRCRWGTVYGDQGLFAARDAYEAGPGFAVQPLFEEVGLVRALKHTGRFVALPLPITICARRWERDGYAKRTLLNRLLAVGFCVGISPARLARWHGGRLAPAPAGHAGAGRARTLPGRG
ncbi:MAG: hypothetical protein ACREU3_09795 [Steroidobacteraceae bacterium]